MDDSQAALPPYFMYGEQDENGVDLSLIREQLKLSPRERLVRMNQFARQCIRLLEAGRKHRENQRADRQR